VTGASGATGASGVRGTTGSTGPTGPTGPQAITAGLFYNNSVNTVTVAANGDLPLTVAASANTAGAFGFTSGSGTITVLAAGTYYISYQVPVASNGTPVLGIAINGTLGQAGLSVNGGGNNTVYGFTLATLAANATVSIRNATGATLNTVTIGAGYAGELYLEKVS
jgi:hypothetical protein